jgi:hypothetical protein
VRDSTANLAAASNVYYLPAFVTAPEPQPEPSRWTNLGRTWWRLRFALAGIRLALRPQRAPLFVEDDTMAILGGQAEVVERRRRPARPARVIDFDTARARLRPVAAN